MGEGKTPSPCPCYLQQARELAQGQENGEESNSSLAEAHRRADPVSLLGSTLELTLFFGGGGTGESAPRESVKAEELTLILICSLQQ